MDYAQAGKRVLLVDADLRKPYVGASFELTDEPGLAGVLLGDVPLTQALRPWKDGHLQVLTSGARPDRPSELLASSKIAELLQTPRDQADLVIIDSAPVMAVADTTGLVAHADAALVVVRVGSTARSARTSTVARLQSFDTRAVGVVANKGRTDGSDGHYAPKERRGLRRRSQAVELLDVPVETVQPMGALARATAVAPAKAGRHDRGRPAEAAGSLSFVAWPEAAGVEQDPPPVGQA